MNIRQLKYFIAAAEELNIGRAAARLNVSQPPVTRQIQQLEEELKAQLFLRTPRGVELTQAGEIFFAEARNIVGLLDQAGGRVRRAAQGEEGRLDVAIFGSAIIGFIPRIVLEFKRLYPNVHVALRAMDKIQQVEGLRSRAIDLGFNRLMNPEEGLMIEEIARERLVAAVSSEGPLAGLGRATLAELAREPLILFPASRAFGFVDVVKDLFRSQRLKPEVAQVVGDAFTGLALAAAGFGVCLAPESMKSVSLRGVVFLEIDLDPAPTVDLSCVYRAGDVSPVLRNFLEVAREGGIRELGDLRRPS